MSSPRRSRPSSFRSRQSRASSHRPFVSRAAKSVSASALDVYVHDPWRPLGPRFLGPLDRLRSPFGARTEPRSGHVEIHLDRSADPGDRGFTPADGVDRSAAIWAPWWSGSRSSWAWWSWLRSRPRVRLAYAVSMVNVSPGVVAAPPRPRARHATSVSDVGHLEHAVHLHGGPSDLGSSRARLVRGWRTERRDRGRVQGGPHGSACVHRRHERDRRSSRRDRCGWSHRLPW